MMANAAFLAALTVFLVVGELASELSFLAPFKAGLFRLHGTFILGAVLLLFFNLSTAYYSIARWLFLGDAGRKTAACRSSAHDAGRGPRRPGARPDRVTHGGLCGATSTTTRAVRIGTARRQAGVGGRSRTRPTRAAAIRATCLPGTWICRAGVCASVSSLAME